MMNNLEMYENLKGILVYVLAGKEFCCDLHSVVNIKKADEVLSKKMIRDNKTVFNNGSTYQIINFNKVFGYKDMQLNEQTRLIFLEEFSKKVCFFVEEIVEIITIENIMIDNSIELEPCNQDYLKYNLVHNKKQILWPDYEKIFRDINQFIGVSLKTFMTNILI